jgi:hypothetical protein
MALRVVDEHARGCRQNTEIWPSLSGSASCREWGPSHASSFPELVESSSRKRSTSRS